MIYNRTSSRGFSTVYSIVQCMLRYYSHVYIRIEKYLQCEKLLGLAEGNIKKRGNKKSGENITPIRYNVIHMYIFARRFIR